MKRIVAWLLCAMLLLGACPAAFAQEGEDTAIIGAQEGADPADDAHEGESLANIGTQPTAGEPVAAPQEGPAAADPQGDAEAADEPWAAPDVDLKWDDTVPPAEKPVVSIGSQEDMLLLSEDLMGNYELSCDIDMGGVYWRPIPFYGKLNGNGHTLYNLTVTSLGAEKAITFDGNYGEYETVFGGLFSVVKNAEIKGLNLVNAMVTAKTNQNCFLGTVAGYAEHTAFVDCSVQARNQLTLSSLNAGVGGVAGYSVESTFVNCTLDVELIFTDVNQDQLCEQYLGGVYANGSGQIDRCTVRTRGYAEVYGYLHSGGLIGMFRKLQHPSLSSFVRDTTADTEISFFEIAPTRKAYCSPTIAEDVQRACYRQQMLTLHYVSNESRVPKRMAPETCEDPRYTFEVVPGQCTAWGYTVHTCAGCGYSYRDSYTPPAHQYEVISSIPATCTEAGQQTLMCVNCLEQRTEAIPALGHNYVETVQEPTCLEPGERIYTCSLCGDSFTEPIPPAGHTPGEWVTVIEPQVDMTGEEVLLCAVCGEELDRREAAALPHVYAEKIILNTDSLTLVSEQGARLTGTLVPEDVTDQELIFTSSDDTVATIMANGRIVAGRRGEAVITVTSADGKASATCHVTVTFTRWQWVKYILSFGWLVKK